MNSNKKKELHRPKQAPNGSKQALIDTFSCLRLSMDNIQRIPCDKVPVYRHTLFLVFKGYGELARKTNSGVLS